MFGTLDFNSVSITTLEQLKQLYLWNLLKAFRCIKRVSSLLQMNQETPNFGRAKCQTVDEFGNKRKMEGHVTEAHKPIASASEITSTTARSSSRNFGRSHSQKAYDESIIGCVSFMVILEFYLCTEKEDCTTAT